jgi:hypothetical protein
MKTQVGHNRAKTPSVDKQQTCLPSSAIYDHKLTMSDLDAHARPPELFRQQFKYYQKASIDTLDVDPDLFDLVRPNLSSCYDRNFFHHPPDDITNLYSTFLGNSVNTLPPSISNARLYEHPDLPGMPLAEHGSRSSCLSLW